MIHRTILHSAFAFVVTLLLSATAHAQLFRSYLAVAGNDANPCTLPAPCRLLPAALAAVADGGEIWMLDSANYNTGPVDITKSVTILAVPGVVGSVLAAGGSAIRITTAGVKVALRNLVIVPLPGGGGANGIFMNNGAGLTVENCLIANLPGAGIQVNAPASVRVTDTTIRDNSGRGMLLQNGVRATVTRATISGNDIGVFVYVTVAGTLTAVDIADSTMDGNTQGFLAFTDGVSAVVRASVRDSRVVRNTTHGLGANSGLAGGTVTLSASNNIISNNGDAGIVVFTTGKVWASGNTVSGNATGLWNTTGTLESAGNNAVRNNGADTSGTITAVATM